MPYSDKKVREEYYLKYRMEHREHARLKTREWYRNNIKRAIESAKAYRTTPKGSFTHTRILSRRRGLVFTLTFEEFCSMWQKPCFYCDDPIDRIGIDRVDNDRGYETGNVVPCCFICNTAKRNLTVLNFIDRCSRIARKHGDL